MNFYWYFNAILKLENINPYYADANTTLFNNGENKYLLYYTPYWLQYFLKIPFVYYKICFNLRYASSGGIRNYMINLSILLITINTLRFYLIECLIIFYVINILPYIASITNTTPSHILNPATSSPKKLVCPGVSIILSK